MPVPARKAARAVASRLSAGRAILLPLIESDSAASATDQNYYERNLPRFGGACFAMPIVSAKWIEPEKWITTPIPQIPGAASRVPTPQTPQKPD